MSFNRYPELDDSIFLLAGPLAQGKGKKLRRNRQENVLHKTHPTGCIPTFFKPHRALMILARFLNIVGQRIHL